MNLLEQARSLMGSGASNPLELFAGVLSAFGPEPERAAREAVALIAGAEKFGPPQPPPWAWALFRRAGDRHNWSPEMLAAVAAATSRFDPNTVTGEVGPEKRLGLMGLPGTMVEDPDRVLATRGDLRAGIPERVQAVGRCVERAADLLDTHRAARGIVGGLFMYAQDYTPSVPVNRILWAFTTYAARRPNRERMDGLRSRLTEETNG